MKIKRSNSSMFEGSSRRRGGFPIIRVVVAILVLALLFVAWQRGGERPMAPVEKAIPADQLGK